MLVGLMGVFLHDIVLCYVGLGALFWILVVSLLSSSFDGLLLATFAAAFICRRI